MSAHVNPNELLQDFSSKVELNQRLSADQDQPMAFPYSKPVYNQGGAIPVHRQTYHYGSGPIKMQSDISKGGSYSDALVRTTPKTMSLVDRGASAASYQVEHLASFQHESTDREITPEAAVQRLTEISEDGGLYSQLMAMKVTDQSIMMANGETMELIETYELDNISFSANINAAPLIENLFVFSTKYSTDKVGAIHLFHCKPKEAQIINADIHRRLHGKAEGMSSAMVNGGFTDNEPMKLNGHHTELKVNADKNVARKNLDNIGYSHDEQEPSSPTHGTGVHQRVEAFQKIAESPTSTEVVRTGSKSSFDYGSKEVRQAKINRDVETLNRCIDEIEAFIIELKTMNDARKKLNHKGSRKSMKKKYEHQRTLAKGPDERRIQDIYQKFKFAFNLLGKLRPHINNPNAPELVNYLFVPLEIIVKVLGLESARVILSPLLTVAAIDLLSNCLKSRDQEFWKSLGQNWLLPVSAPVFNNKNQPVYIPVFKDGWVPREIVVDDRSAAAAKSAAAMVERMKIVEEEEEHKKRALEEKRSQEEKHHYDLPPVKPIPATTVVVREEETIEQKAEKPKGKPADLPKLQLSGEKKYALVIYDYWAHNNKELTIRAGEKVLIIDNSRRWWLVQNQHEEKGYVPSTVLELATEDSSSETSSADSSMSPAASPSSTQNISITRQIHQTKVERAVSVEEAVSTQPTVVTAKSIITESSQFSNPSSPITSTPPTIVVQKEIHVKETTEEHIDPPTFLPPPPPMPQVSPPSSPPSTQPVAAVAVKEKIPVAKKDSQEKTFQEELNDRLQKQESIVSSENTLSAVDKVDFFIPLFKSSTADDVTRWLKRMKFEPLTVERLSGVAAKELFKIPEDDLVERLGEDEGKRLYNELQVQTGAITRHKTMTEFQKALIERMKRQETIQKNVTKHHVTVKTNVDTTSPSQDDLQRKFKEQQDLIRSQQNESGDREPEKQTFSSFLGGSTPNENNNESAPKMADDNTKV